MGKPLSPEDSWRRIDPADRARQFMPFAALRGYYDLVREVEHIPEPKRTITEEHALSLSQTISSLKKEMIVKATYYDGDAYLTIEGIVSRIDEVFRVLDVVKTHIPFDDLWDVEILKS